MYQFTKDRRTLDQQIAKAQDITGGKRSMVKARFVSGKGKNIGLNQADIDRVKALQGIKGFVTSAPEDILTNAEVIAHYHALFEVESSFRLTKHDLEARPMFHRTQEMIDAHLNIVFCALAMALYLQTITGYSLRRIRDILRPLTDGILEFNGRQHSIPAAITPDASELIASLALQID